MGTRGVDFGGGGTKGREWGSVFEVKKEQPGLVGELLPRGYKGSGRGLLNGEFPFGIVDRVGGSYSRQPRARSNRNSGSYVCTRWEASRSLNFRPATFKVGPDLVEIRDQTRLDAEWIGSVSISLDIRTSIGL